MRAWHLNPLLTKDQGNHVPDAQMLPGDVFYCLDNQTIPFWYCAFYKCVKKVLKFSHRCMGKSWTKTQ